MTKSDIVIASHNIDQRMWAIETALDKLKDMEYATEHLTLSIMLAEYQAKFDNLNAKNK
jgi:hypothetical protein